MWLLWLATQMIPPVEVAKEGWWMVDQGSLSRRAVQTQPGQNLAEMVLFWRDTVGRGAVGSPVIGDVDGDGENEVVILKHEELHVVDVPNRTVVWRFTPPDSANFGGFCIYNTPSLGDVDGDGVVEIVAMDDSHRVWILDAASRQVDKMIRLPTYNSPDSPCPRTPVHVLDPEQDGIPGIIVGGMAYQAPTNLYYILPCASRLGGVWCSPILDRHNVRAHVAFMQLRPGLH